MENAVAIAAIALATTAVGALVWGFKWLAEKLTKVLEDHTTASLKQAASSDEVLKFMKNLNGKFEKAYVEKRKEVEKKK